ncbi:MAG: hypothetical protein IS860_08010 [Nitrosopumilus sp.]|nr:hypothetical protein [Nitrosopumilus sp.]
MRIVLYLKAVEIKAEKINWKDKPGHCKKKFLISDQRNKNGWRVTWDSIVKNADTFKGRPGISDEQKEEIKNEILEKQFVLTFKETFSDHREKFDDMHNNGLTYTLQAHNKKTGNTLSLFVEYYQNNHPFAMGSSTVRESIACEPNDDKIVYDTVMPFYRPPHGMNNLFIDEKILNSTCLDDDWEPTAVVLKENTP